MSITPEQTTALRALRGLSPQERVAAMYALDQADLAAAEKAKDLGPISADWEKLKAHMLDGGGMTDAAVPIRAVLTAVLDDNQVTFWPELIHAFKAAAKQLGIVTVEGSQVQLSGIAPTRQPPAREQLDQPPEKPI